MSESQKKPSYSNIVDTFISDCNFRKFNIVVARELGSIEYAVILNDMLDQYNYLTRENKLISHLKYGDGLMFYTQAQAWDRCAVNRKPFETALKKFIYLGFISVVKFGMPYKSYYKINKEAIGEWLSNLSYSLSKRSNKHVQRSKQACPKEQTYDKENDNEYVSKNIDIPTATPKRSPLNKCTSTVFDPSTYELRNGQSLSLRTQRAFAKYTGKDREKLLRNIFLYENHCDEGKEIKTTHEKYLQWLISKDLANSQGAMDINRRYAEFVRAEHGERSGVINNMQILKTVIKIDQESISLNLPVETFADILDNYIKKIRR
jgi:hypothetical protein